MKLIYTNRILVDTTGTLIVKGRNIPDDVDIKQVTIVPDGVSDYYIKGLHSDSDWVLVENGSAFEITGLTSSTWDVLYVKAASSTINLNLLVKGM